MRELLRVEGTVHKLVQDGEMARVLAQEME